MNPLDLRPSEIVEMFWREQIVIEEDALVLPPVYFEMDEVEVAA
jgi:hypothetical protein